MRSATYTMVGEDISEERVLAEIPELAITETDREILSALGASPSVQAAVAGGEPFIDLPPAEHRQFAFIQPVNIGILHIDLSPGRPVHSP